MTVKTINVRLPEALCKLIEEGFAKVDADELAADDQVKAVFAKYGV
jgi:hypothetical protein